MNEQIDNFQQSETYEKDANTKLEELPKDKAGTI